VESNFFFKVVKDRFSESGQRKALCSATEMIFDAACSDAYAGCLLEDFS
tara:strand:+ start:458 stop:604 length:147 start_codon:yes stop_codon:yes gene_type:complete